MTDAPTLMGDMPPEYTLWVDEMYDDMVKFARSRGGDAGAVDDAILRTSHSDAFPVNDATLWWTWHCGAIRSYLSNRARGRERDADLAREVAGAISTERGTRALAAPTFPDKTSRRGPRANLVVFHTEEDKPEVTILRPKMVGWFHVREVGRCDKCGLQVRWELEREDDDPDAKPDYIPVLACYGCGRRRYNREGGSRVQA